FLISKSWSFLWCLTRSHFLDSALHIEIAFRNCVVLAFEDLLESANGIRHRDLFSFMSGECLRNTKWLAQEALYLAGAEHCLLIFSRQLIDAEDCDDILQVLEPLQHLLNSPRHVIMLFTDYFGRKRP